MEVSPRLPCERYNVWIDTVMRLCETTRMKSSTDVTFTYRSFQPAELEAITGLKPALIRDWRRRSLIHPSLDRTTSGFPAATVAEFMLLARLSDHGIGPKRVYGWSRAFAGKILTHALDDVSAWASADDYDAWQTGGATAAEQFLAIWPAPGGMQARHSLDGILNGADLVTIVDLRAMGSRFRDAAGGPIASAMRLTDA